MSADGLKQAAALWVGKEKEAGEKGLWVCYSFCAHCFSFYPRQRHTDDDAVAHFRGGELELLTFFARQRVSCDEVIGRCKECYNVVSRTGKWPDSGLTEEEAKHLARWVNGGGLAEADR